MGYIVGIGLWAYPPLPMDFAPPPRYRRSSTRPGPAPQSGVLADLPAYTRRNTLAQPVAPIRDPTEHVYPLLDGKAKPWATLKVYSSAKSPKSLPTFFEKEHINCSVEINADKGDSIHAISATITGRIITGANSDDSLTFLSQTQPIWAKSSEAPRIPSPSMGTTGTKLLGHCVWKLSIVLPRAVTLPSSLGEPGPFRLPETFLERHTRASIQYDLGILISRGKLRADSHIKTAFGYVPSSRPDPSTVFRQLAYQQGLALPGPDADPEGWKTLRPISVRGKMFSSRQVEAKCTLSLAKPLCYTRGSVIPCFMVLEARDSQLLDLLSAPSSVVVRLRRRVRFYNKPSSVRQDVAWNEAVEDMGTAVWWPSGDGRSDSYTRRLEGELRLPKDLRPSSAMGHFSITYSMVLYPFDAASFSSESAPLLSEPIEIATMHAKGPRPLAYAPPAYDSNSRTNDDFMAHLHGLHITT